MVHVAWQGWAVCRSAVLSLMVGSKHRTAWWCLAWCPLWCGTVGLAPMVQPDWTRTRDGARACVGQRRVPWPRWWRMAMPSRAACAILLGGCCTWVAAYNARCAVHELAAGVGRRVAKVGMHATAQAHRDADWPWPMVPWVWVDGARQRMGTWLRCKPLAQGVMASLVMLGWDGLVRCSSSAMGPHGGRPAAGSLLSLCPSSKCFVAACWHAKPQSPLVARESTAERCALLWLPVGRMGIQRVHTETCVHAPCGLGVWSDEGPEPLPLASSESPHSGRGALVLVLSLAGSCEDPRSDPTPLEACAKDVGSSRVCACTMMRSRQSCLDLCGLVVGGKLGSFHIPSVSTAHIVDCCPIAQPTTHRM